MSVGGKTVCLGGDEEQVERGGRGFRAGGGGVGGVRIAGCGWVCQCHVSRLAPLASRLEGCWTENLVEPVRLLSEPKVG